MVSWRDIFSRRTPDTSKDDDPPRNSPFWCGTAKSPFVATSVLHHVLLQSHNVDQDEAALYVADCMGKTRPRDWMQLYDTCKTPYISNKNIAEFASLYHKDISVELLGVASLNRDGRIRQAAIEAIEQLDHPRALPYILLRLSDWVPQVRRAAELVLDKMLRAGMAPEFMKYCFLIKHLEKIQRVDLSHIRQRMHNFLCSQDGRTDLEAGLTANEPQVRIFCYEVLADELNDRPDLIEKAIDDSDPRIGHWIARFILDNPAADTEKRLEKLLHSRCARIQTEVIRTMTHQMQQNLSAALLELIFANAPSVRKAARFVLRRQGQADFAATYRQKISQADNEGVRPGWIAGLGETGAPSDYDQAAKFLQHRRVKVRAAAFTAMACLDRKRAIPVALEYLNDPNRKIRSVAIAALTAERTPDIIKQTAIVMQTGTPSGQTAAFTVLASQGGWEVLPHAMEALLQGNESLTQQAWQCILGWRNRYFSLGWIQPTGKTLTQIERQLTLLESANIQTPLDLAAAWADIMTLIRKDRK